jgi:hypothetical protein
MSGLLDSMRVCLLGKPRRQALSLSSESAPMVGSPWMSSGIEVHGHKPASESKAKAGVDSGADPHGVREQE